MDKQFEKYMNLKDYRKTREVMSRNRSLLNFLRPPATNEPGPSGEFPITTTLFVTPPGRHNRLAALLPQRYNSEARLDSIPSAGSLEALSSTSSSGSGTYYSAESSSGWSFIDSEITLVQFSNWLRRTKRWLERYGLYLAVGAAGGCLLGYIFTRTYKN